ncbi:hypothetical protein ASPBRDRAFT_201578 [Aspergillus brasiliensis CBS 101740]|uniref:Zn(2)-C6 fungal-type domain-containing protein n=1 Tax=Aspergillus brasiliensis (strain CBS 101740 / IMI 381727 / IBT 21946) TaxID=767769 RepID=A0A1L9U261_ASPBC|nr:hypothetical protein ASPBRDRAFT_201578 [Aspergillus brasiliensis CBS 101740]
MAEKDHHRPLLPATEAQHKLESSPAKPPKRRSLACQQCRKNRTKCVGSPTCEACKQSETECIFEPHKDRRRKASRHHVEERLYRYERVLTLVLQILRYGEMNGIGFLNGIVTQAPTLEDAISELQMISQIN